jgi:hypothetical protein
MAVRKFLVDIDLNLNQLQNSRLQNGTGYVTGGSGSVGRLMYDTATSRVLYDTGTAIQTVANLNDVAGLLDFKGGYDASTNTPNLTVPTAGTVLKGDFYVVTVAGSFFGVALEVGDSLIAEIDNPSTINDWVILQGNVVYATETVAGIIRISTNAEAISGSDDTTAITPLKLNQVLQHYAYTRKYSVSGQPVNTTPLILTHNLGTEAVQVVLFETGTKNQIEAQVSVSNINAVQILGNNTTTVFCDINIIG